MPRVRAPLQGAPPAVNIVQESPLTHDTHLPPPTHRPSHLSPTLPTCSPRMPPGHPLERTSGGTDWTPRARIGNCGFRPGRTSPTDDYTQTPVVCGKTQSSIKKYVPGAVLTPRAKPHRTARTPTCSALNLKDAPQASRTAPEGSLRPFTCVRTVRSATPPAHTSGPPRTPPAKHHHPLDAPPGGALLAETFEVAPTTLSAPCLSEGP